jgi:hypothetical protein
MADLLIQGGSGHSDQESVDLREPDVDPELHKGNESVPEGIDTPVFSSVSDGYLAEVSTHVIKEFPKYDLRLQGGFFQTEQKSGDIWASLRYTPVAVRNEWYEGAVDLQTGPSIHLPYSAKSEAEHSKLAPSYSMFAMTSLQAYFGAKQDINSWFGLRQAVEGSAWFLLGKNISPNYEAPLKIGSSLLFKTENSTSVAVGAKAVFPINNQDVQDIQKTYPNFEHVESFVSITSRYIDFDVSMQHYLNSQSITAEIGKEYEISQGDSAHYLTPTVSTQQQLGGDAIYFVGGVFLGLKYAFGNSEHNVRAEANVTAGFSPSDNGIDGHYIDSGSADLTAALWGASGTLARLGRFHELKGKEIEHTDGVFHLGEMDVESDSCKVVGVETWLCDSTDGPAYMQARVERKDGVYKVMDTRSKYSNDVVGDFLREDTYKGYISRLKKYSKHEQIKALQLLAHVGYETYDEVGKYLSNGSGQVNNISNEDIYTTARAHQLGNSSRPTTVCRGFAAFVTETAEKLGFEAHSAVISTGKLGHVISLIREPGKLSFEVINYGSEGRSYGTASIARVLDAYCEEMGYGPQVNYKIYDAKGKYVRTIDTNYGSQVKARMTVPSRLDPFLKGKRGAK